MERANRRRMTIELAGRVTRKPFKLNPRAFGKLLHVARLHGWDPEQLPEQTPTVSWDTQVVLPHFGPYLPGSFSPSDAEGLRRALVKASATGAIAVEGTLQIAAQTLLHVAKEGGFEVRLTPSDCPEPSSALASLWRSREKNHEAAPAGVGVE
jgi:hypothetical protein